MDKVLYEIGDILLAKYSSYSLRCMVLQISNHSYAPIIYTLFVINPDGPGEHLNDTSIVTVYQRDISDVRKVGHIDLSELFDKSRWTENASLNSLAERVEKLEKRMDRLMTFIGLHS